jgi:hypothetical protein
VVSTCDLSGRIFPSKQRDGARAVLVDGTRYEYQYDMILYRCTVPVLARNSEGDNKDDFKEERASAAALQGR